LTSCAPIRTELVDAYSQPATRARAYRRSCHSVATLADESPAACLIRNQRPRRLGQSLTYAHFLPRLAVKAARACHQSTNAYLPMLYSEWDCAMARSTAPMAFIYCIYALQPSPFGAPDFTQGSNIRGNACNSRAVNPVQRCQLHKLRRRRASCALLSANIDQITTGSRL
jgi:hypothetical protein